MIIIYISVQANCNELETFLISVSEQLVSFYKFCRRTLYSTAETSIAGCLLREFCCFKQCHPSFCYNHETAWPDQSILHYLLRMFCCQVSRIATVRLRQSRQVTSHGSHSTQLCDLKLFCIGCIGSSGGTTVNLLELFFGLI